MGASKKVVKEVVAILKQHAGEEAALHIAQALATLNSNKDFMATAAAILAEFSAVPATPVTPETPR